MLVNMHGACTMQLPAAAPRLHAHGVRHAPGLWWSRHAHKRYRQTVACHDAMMAAPQRCHPPTRFCGRHLEGNIKYLVEMIDADMLLYPFRINAGLTAPKFSYVVRCARGLACMAHAGAATACDALCKGPADTLLRAITL